MNTNGQDVLKFTFQEVELSELATLFPTRSKYGALQEQIVERVNQMDQDKSFIFAPEGKGKVSESMSHSICVGVNKKLIARHLPWRLRYSTKAKAFAVTPIKGASATRKPKEVVPKEVKPAEGFTGDAAARLEQLVGLIKKKFGVTVRQLQENPPSADIQDVQRAAFYVGRNGMGLRLTDIARLIAMTSSSQPTILCQQALSRPSAKEKVNALVEELNKS